MDDPLIVGPIKLQGRLIESVEYSYEGWQPLQKFIRVKMRDGVIALCHFYLSQDEPCITLTVSGPSFTVGVDMQEVDYNNFCNWLVVAGWREEMEVVD